MNQEYTNFFNEENKTELFKKWKLIKCILDQEMS